MRRTIALVAGLAVLVLLAAARPATSPEAAQAHARAWPAWLTACDVAGVELARCGAVAVSESAEPPHVRQIRIRVIVIPASAAPPLPDPVVLLVGGPGQGAADLAPGLARGFAFLRETRDLVLIDQRGTGQSNGLACPPPARVEDLFGKIFDPD